MLDERFRIVGELVFVLPVLRFGIIGAEFDDHDVGVAGGRVLELLGFPVGQVSLLEEGGSAATEVLRFEGRSEECSEDLWVMVFVTLFDSGTEGDAVTDARDERGFFRFGSLEGDGDGQRESEGEE